MAAEGFAYRIGTHRPEKETDWSPIFRLQGPKSA
jgi:hypothetical protein